MSISEHPARQRARVAAVGLLVFLCGLGVGAGLGPGVHGTPAVAAGARPAPSCTPELLAYAGGSPVTETRCPDSGPALPASVAGDPVVCQVMADTGSCVSVYVLHEGQCLSLFWTGQSAGTDQGWVDETAGDPPAAFECPLPPSG